MTWDDDDFDDDDEEQEEEKAGDSYEGGLISPPSRSFDVINEISHKQSGNTIRLFGV